MKNQNIINYSPSEFAFDYKGCKKCYYDTKINNITLKTPFPGAFSKFDREQKKYYNDKSSKIISKDLEDGVIVSNYNKKLKSKILYDKKKRPFTLGGFIDAYIDHKNSYTVVDFKTTTISEEEPVKYKAQLQCYAMIMENPAEGSLKLNPVKNLGILCFDPGEITQVNETDCDFKMNTKWFNINRDDDELLSYITEVQDLLHQTKAPRITKSCKICEFREKIKHEK